MADDQAPQKLHKEPTDTGVDSKVLSDLHQLAAQPAMLRIKILAKAHLFLEARTLNALKSKTYTWLADALIGIRANSSMDTQTKLGLLMANTT
jgi:hypothetical protein